MKSVNEKIMDKFIADYPEIRSALVGLAYSIHYHLTQTLKLPNNRESKLFVQTAIREASVNPRYNAAFNEYSGINRHGVGPHDIDETAMKEIGELANKWAKLLPRDYEAEKAQGKEAQTAFIDFFLKAPVIVGAEKVANTHMEIFAQLSQGAAKYALNMIDASLAAEFRDELEDDGYPIEDDVPGVMYENTVNHMSEAVIWAIGDTVAKLPENAAMLAATRGMPSGQNNLAHKRH